jgi:hypothetical protein
MRKHLTLFVFSLIMLASGSVKAQKNVVKFLPVGGMIQSVHDEGYTSTLGSYQLGFGFERVFGTKTSGQIDVGMILPRMSYSGLSIAGAPMGYLKPAFKYYLLKDAPHGLSIGAYVPLAFNADMVIIGFGPQAGYQMFFLENKLAVGADLGLGFGYSAGPAGGNAGVNFDISVGAGYAF